MKTKLLRKVRKRYSIVYRPYFKPTSTKKTYGMIEVVDRDNRDSFSGRDGVKFMCYIKSKPYFSTNHAYETREEGYKAALAHLIKLILSDYAHLGTRRNKLFNKQEKLWFNN